MATCTEMKEGDLYVCQTCGLELQVIKTCMCIAGEEVSCTVPLQCCGKEMTKKQVHLFAFFLYAFSCPTSMTRILIIAFSLACSQLDAEPW